MIRARTCSLTLPSERQRTDEVDEAARKSWQEVAEMPPFAVKGASGWRGRGWGSPSLHPSLHPSPEAVIWSQNISVLLVVAASLDAAAICSVKP